MLGFSGKCFPQMPHGLSKSERRTSMKNDVYLENWNIEGDKVRLTYKDGTDVFVKKTDFDRAFGCIVSAPKSDIVRDFAIA